MISFECDYLEGCHEKILEALVVTNRHQQVGYGFDAYTQEAKKRIQLVCGCPDADIYFVNGGTQTNQLVIDSMLKPYEGVISADTGHVNAHEAGAIEFSGHKVLALPSSHGKIDAKQVDAYIESFYAESAYDHMVFPGMVYISFPTEYGTLYTKEELTQLSAVCQKHKIPFYIDGARLGYGLCAPGNDVSIQFLSSICDVFYIGGTKVGALSGEAIVFTKNNTPSHFLTRIKQHGALSAKGRLIGLQFLTLFTDDLYFSISRHAIDMAMRVKEMFTRLGYTFYLDSSTNQQFVILENAQLKKLQEKVAFGIWEPYDSDHTVVRFATSWATTDAQLTELEAILKEIG